MRRLVEESKRRKRLKKDLAGSNLDVVEMDKIGQIEYNSAESNQLAGKDMPKSRKGRKKLTGNEKASGNSIILVQQTKIIEEEKKIAVSKTEIERKSSSGESSLYQVVDVQDR